MGDVVQIGDATLYHGDCLEILPTLPKVDAVVTDPVWPNAPASLPGYEDPYGLLVAAARLFEPLCFRVALCFSAMSDPRILAAMSLPFFRVCWMDYARPSYIGRTLAGAEIAYLFGEPPPSRPGLRVIPGILPRAQPTPKNGHPCPRNIEHMNWLVGRWSVEGLIVVDPFMGSGTTGIACNILGRKFIGVEIERKYFDIACERIAAAHAQQRLFA